MVEGSRRWAQKGDWDLSSVSFRRKLDRADRFWSRGLGWPGQGKDRAGTQLLTGQARELLLARTHALA